jgi:16S rRNA (uracil1498-N3)-methyltransferase
VRRRFFVEQFVDKTAVIEGDTAHHLGHVLRAQKDQMYELSDGAAAWLGRIESVGRDRVVFSLLEQLPEPRPAVEITLLLSIVKFDAFEWAIQKATELGVGSIVPLAAARSEKGLLAAAEKRSQRWKKILLEASQQSRRLRVPVLESLGKPIEVFAAYSDPVRLMLSERGDAPTIRKALEGAKWSKAVLAIGPEGGWTDEEISYARAAGFLEVSLGQLILRTETAVVASLAMVNYALGPDW